MDCVCVLVRAKLSSKLKSHQQSDHRELFPLRTPCGDRGWEITLCAHMCIKHRGPRVCLFIFFLKSETTIEYLFAAYRCVSVTRSVKSGRISTYSASDPSAAHQCRRIRGLSECVSESFPSPTSTLSLISQFLHIPYDLLRCKINRVWCLCLFVSANGDKTLSDGFLCFLSQTMRLQQGFSRGRRGTLLPV